MGLNIYNLIKRGLSNLFGKPSGLCKAGSRSYVTAEPAAIEFCGSSSVVECLLAKEKVAGSSPVFRFLYMASDKLKPLSIKIVVRSDSTTKMDEYYSCELVIN